MEGLSKFAMLIAEGVSTKDQQKVTMLDLEDAGV
jgi:hypothetical protein